MIPLRTRVTQDGCGVQEVRYEPDCAAPGHDTLDNLREIIPTLQPRDRIIVEGLTTGHGLGWKLGRTTYTVRYRRYRQLLKRLRTTILEPD
jgi:hypothetical protein